MKSVFVFACYKPKAGKENLLREAVSEHMPVLRNEGLVTDRQCYVMKSKDGSIIEVFEWKSEEAIEAAHRNPRVLELWKKFEEACDYIPVGEIAEAKHVFSNFEPMNI